MLEKMLKSVLSCLQKARLNRKIKITGCKKGSVEYKTILDYLVKVPWASAVTRKVRIIDDPQHYGDDYIAHANFCSEKNGIICLQSRYLLKEPYILYHELAHLYIDNLTFSEKKFIWEWEEAGLPYISEYAEKEKSQTENACEWFMEVCIARDGLESALDGDNISEAHKEKAMSLFKKYKFI